MRYRLTGKSILLFCILIQSAVHSFAGETRPVTWDGLSPPYSDLAKDQSSVENDLKFKKFMGGDWDGLGRGAESVFGSIKITADNLSWGNAKKARCSTKYRVLFSRIAKMLPNYFFSPRTYPDNTSFYIARVEILNPRCKRVARFLELAKPSSRDVLEVIASDNDNQVIGYLLFGRIAEE